MPLSVIIPVFNCERFIGQAVQSAFESAPPQTEILVVDDGSQDGTCRVVEGLIQANPGRLRLLRHADAGNHGPGATRNLGITESKGDLIAFLDGDDYYLPQRFDQSLHVLASRSDVDGVYGVTRIEYESEEQRRICGGAGTLGLSPDVAPESLLQELLQGRFWHANTLTVRRSLLERTGAFAEHLRVAEDCHLWLRLAALGRLVSVESASAMAVYRRRGGSVSTPGFDSKADLVQALAEVSRWGHAKRLTRAVRATLTHGTREYLIASMASALSMKRPDMARTYAMRAVRGAGVRVLADRRVLRLAVAAALRM